MLSRVAERVYWFSRYLERVESIARLIQVYTSLLSDLPKDTGISWHNLVLASGSHAEFERRFQVKDEKRVVRFLLEDQSNTSSLAFSLKMVRENIRTSRDTLPPESWELINEFQIFVSENIQQGINRRNRHEFLEQVIRTCQGINGLIADTMRRDGAWHFLRLGKNLERADMSLRTVEAGASMSAEFAAADMPEAAEVVWSSVLHTLDAMTPYKRTMRVAVSGEDAAAFLLEDALFPRSVACCVRQMQESLDMLPDGVEVKKTLAKIAKPLGGKIDYVDLQKLLVFIDSMELHFRSLHSAVDQAWFQPR
ncbi:MAG: alpha-E domain-containing protein [Spongiibacter sp.]|nr:alpha-E domain-containing protein [Spongiibacter sp.]